MDQLKLHRREFLRPRLKPANCALLALVALLSFTYWILPVLMPKRLPQVYQIPKSMVHTRAQHSAVTLKDGKVLIFGGQGSGPTSAEWFNPDTGEFHRVPGQYKGVYSSQAVLLPNGDVLLLGLFAFDMGISLYRFDTFVIYSHFDKQFISGRYSLLRVSHASATLLQNGLVLIAGGWYWETRASVMFFDFANRSFRLSPTSMNFARYGHTATALPNGNVLFVGGAQRTNLPHRQATPNGLSNGPRNATRSMIRKMELYDPSTNTFSVVGKSSVRRERHTATLLSNERDILLCGGAQIDAQDPKENSEICNVSTLKCRKTSSPMLVPRYGHTATLLPNGRVLIVGGVTDSYPFSTLAKCEIFDPETESYQYTSDMSVPRIGHSATLLSSGMVLIAGGYSGGEFLSSTEMYDPLKQVFVMAE